MAKIKRRFTARSQGLLETFDDAVVCLVCVESNNVILTRGFGRWVESIEKTGTGTWRTATWTGAMAKVLLLLVRGGVTLRSWFVSKNNVIMFRTRQAFGMLFAMCDSVVFVFFQWGCVNNIDRQWTSSGVVSVVRTVGEVA